MKSLHERLLDIVGPLASTNGYGRLVVERPPSDVWERIVTEICMHNLISRRNEWRVPEIGPDRKVLDLEDGQGLGGAQFIAHNLDSEYALLIEPMNGGFSVRLQRRTT